MEFKFEEGILTVYPEGNIDSTNAEAVGNEMEGIRVANPDGKMVMDFENLKYISSAGLRQVLRFKKREKDFKVINVNSEIYEIFDMTGFTEMMEIEKAYRKMDVNGCEKIGEGSNGIVYRINPDTIIKVYKNKDALEDIKRERELAKTALVLGINTAIPFDVVKVDDLYGSVFELLSAKSITKLINADPDNKEKYMRVFVNLLKEIHGTLVKPNVLPDAKARTIGWCEDLKDKLPEATYEKLHKMLEEVPFELNMIHGDYHTNNVHYAGGDPILIDMDTLSTGNPVFEFSNIFLAYHGFGELNHEAVAKFLGIDWDTCQFIWEKVVEYYYEGKDAAYIANVRKKAEAVGFTRLYRRTMKRDSSNTALIDHCRERLIECVDAVDSLTLEHVE